MRTVKNVLKVIASNMTAIVSGLFIGFLIPKIITVSDYGIYKTYALYFSYLGVLSLGIIDGIVLNYGEKDYEELERKNFRSYYAWYFIIQFIFSIVIVAIALCIERTEYKLVIALLGVNLLPANTVGYFQQISQITQRFKEYSRRKITESIINVMIVVCLFVLYKKNEQSVSVNIYLSCLLLMQISLAIWYILTYKDIVFGKRKKLFDSLREVLNLAWTGIPLLLANLCTTLIFSLDRQFVNVLFTMEEYATYAFAYSMLSLITVATSAISIVIYPLFKRLEVTILKTNYKYMISMVLVLAFAVILIYFPLCYFIEWFLPQYQCSISVFRIILPGIAISTAISVIMHNYYKVFGMSKKFFKNCILILVVSLVLNSCAYYIWGTREAISAVSMLALLGWYIITEYGLRKECRGKSAGVLYIIAICVVFYVSTSISTYWIGGVIYTLFFFTISSLFLKKDYKYVKDWLLSLR